MDLKKLIKYGLMAFAPIVGILSIVFMFIAGFNGAPSMITLVVGLIFVAFPFIWFFLSKYNKEAEDGTAFVSFRTVCVAVAAAALFSVLFNVFGKYEFPVWRIIVEAVVGVSLLVLSFVPPATADTKKISNLRLILTIVMAVILLAYFAIGIPAGTVVSIIIYVLRALLGLSFVGYWAYTFIFQ